MKHALPIGGLIGLIMLSGCSVGGAEAYTLYRTSSVAPGLRVNWAHFEAKESSAAYNRDNCMMTARLLTANMKALNGENYDTKLGFWCEPGDYKEDGPPPPLRFDAAYPTDTE